MRKKITIVIVVIFVCITTAGSFYFYRLSLSRKALINTSFINLEESLKKWDAYSFRYYYKKIIAVKVPLPAAKHLLKMVFMFCEQTDDFALLENAAKKYKDRYPKDSDLFAVYTFALIRNGKSKTALQIIENSDFKDKFKSLKEEAQLATGNGIRSRDYLIFNQFAHKTGDYGFVTDAALIAMAENHPESAYNFIKNLPEDYNAKKNLLFHAAFESGRYSDALKILNTYDLGFSIEDILRIVKEESVKFIRLQITDINGVLKNVEIPADELEKALRSGAMFDGSSIDGFVRIQESDMLLVRP